MKNLPGPIQRLSKLLEQELPGREAQVRMAHANRARARAAIRTDVRPAAVLILLYPHHSVWHTVLIKRKHLPGDRHAGQISFPGGRQEPGETLFETAVREAHEEINAPRDRITRLGSLTELHIPVSNYLVQPFVGYTADPYPFKPQESEVDSIIEVPLNRLRDPVIRSRTDIQVANNLRLRDVPCFALDSHVIWGATAMIISEFLTVLATDSSLADAS